jgi:Apea-like HEPN
MNKQIFEAVRGSLVALSKGSTTEVFKTLVNTLQKDEGWEAKFSLAYTEQKVNETIQEIQHKSPAKSGDLLKKLVEHFETYNHRLRVIFAVDNLTVSQKGFRVGKVTFQKMTKNKFRQALNDFKKVVFQNPHHTDEEKKELYLHFEESQTEIFLEKMVAVCEVNAEPEKAVEIAYHETERSIDFLRFISMFTKAKEKVALGLNGEFSPARRDRLILGDEFVSFGGQWAVGGYISQKHKRFALYRTLDLSTKRALAVLKKKEIIQLLIILRKPEKDLKDLEISILSALRWIALAQRQELFEIELLNLITAIEVILNDSERSSQKDIARRATLLTANPNKPDRKNVYGHFLRFFKTRNEVVHSGGVIENFEDVRIARWIVSMLLQKVIRLSDKFSTKKELCEWLDDLSFSGKLILPKQLK